jgi:hypothetical protein
MNISLDAAHCNTGKGGDSMATYAVTCANCQHQRSFPTQQLADADAAAHSRENPTHTAKVHKERR